MEISSLHLLQVMGIIQQIGSLLRQVLIELSLRVYLQPTILHLLIKLT